MKQAFLILFILCTFLSCDKEEDSKPGEVIHATGTIVSRYGLDTCDAYMIEIVEGDGFTRSYKPDTLPKKFKVDGLSINVKYQITEERHSCGFGGYVPVIHIVKISKK